MKLSHRVQIVTGHTCIHIALHLLLLAALVWGWRHQSLLQVSLTLLTMYISTFAVMLFTQRLHRLRPIADFCEEVTTTYYFGAAILLLYVLSHVIPHNVFLVVVGVLMLTGPAVFSLLAKETPRARQRNR